MEGEGRPEKLKDLQLLIFDAVHHFITGSRRFT
jgi:hypothetical protein